MWATLLNLTWDLLRVATLAAWGLFVLIAIVTLISPKGYRGFPARSLIVAIVITSATVGFNTVASPDEPPRIVQLTRRPNAAEWWIVHFSRPVKCIGRIHLSTLDDTMSNKSPDCDGATFRATIRFQFPGGLEPDVEIHQFSLTKATYIVSRFDVEVENYSLPPGLGQP